MACEYSSPSVAFKYCTAVLEERGSTMIFLWHGDVAVLQGHVQVHPTARYWHVDAAILWPHVKTGTLRRSVDAASLGYGDPLRTFRCTITPRTWKWSKSMQSFVWVLQERLHNVVLQRHTDAQSLHGPIHTNSSRTREYTSFWRIRGCSDSSRTHVDRFHYGMPFVPL